MNQILITKKLYITPELKRKKRIYKIDFILSLFLVIILISLYIYAEYDMNKSEQVSQNILANMEFQENDTTTIKKNILIAVLNRDSEEDEEEITNTIQEIQRSQQKEETKQVNNEKVVYKTEKGFRYTIPASISIPKIEIEYPILLGETGSEEETEDLLKNSPCKFWGPDVNEVGNYCIVGHNYRNSKFFSKVPNLVEGDTFTITDVSKRTITYRIYDKYIVDPEDVSCTSQLTNGKKEVTLITCTNDSKQRVIIKAREI